VPSTDDVSIVDPSTPARLKVNADGSIDVNASLGSAAAVTGTPTQVTVDNNVTTILAANSDRKGASIQNEGGGVIRITMGGTDPTATFGTRLLPGEIMVVGQFTGIIEGKREGAVSSVLNVQEFAA